MRVLLLAVMVMLLGACGEETPVTEEPGDGDSPTEDDMEHPKDTEPDAPEGEREPPERVIPEDGDDRESREPPEGAEPGRVAGTLGGDARLEGGCVWVEAGSTRYEISWPDGYTAETDPVRLLRDGEVVAQAGDELAVRGQVDKDAMTVCQIGPVFRANKVELPAE